MSAALHCLLHLGFLQNFASKPVSQNNGEQWHLSRTCLTPVPHSLPFTLQASQLGVYRAFVDNYGVAMETAEKCCQANAQFAEISEVCMMLTAQKGGPLPFAGGLWAGHVSPVTRKNKVHQTRSCRKPQPCFQMPLGWHHQPCAGTLLWTDKE